MEQDPATDTLRAQNRHGSHEFSQNPCKDSSKFCQILSNLAHYRELEQILPNSLHKEHLYDKFPGKLLVNRAIIVPSSAEESLLSVGLPGRTQVPHGMSPRIRYERHAQWQFGGYQETLTLLRKLHHSLRHGSH